MEKLQPKKMKKNEIDIYYLLDQSGMNLTTYNSIRNLLQHIIWQGLKIKELKEKNRNLKEEKMEKRLELKRRNNESKNEFR